MSDRKVYVNQSNNLKKQNSMKKVILLMCVLIGSVCLANVIKSEAQTASSSVCTISVVNEDGDGIRNVLIEDQSSFLQETTGTSGIVLFDCNENTTLIFSHSSYNTTEVSRTNESELTVVMTLKSE